MLPKKQTTTVAVFMTMAIERLGISPSGSCAYISSAVHEQLCRHFLGERILVRIFRLFVAISERRGSAESAFSVQKPRNSTSLANFNFPPRGLGDGWPACRAVAMGVCCAAADLCWRWGCASWYVSLECSFGLREYVGGERRVLE